MSDIIWVLKISYSEGAYSNYECNNMIVLFDSFAKLNWYFFHTFDSNCKHKYLNNVYEDYHKQRSYNVSVDCLKYGQPILLTTSLMAQINQDNKPKEFEDVKYYPDELDILREYLPGDLVNMVLEFLFDIRDSNILFAKDSDTSMYQRILDEYPSI